MKKFSFDIDVVGACNLRCPSCPQGNVRDYRLPHGYMEPELLARIVRKAASECSVERISLFSWGEPLLHSGLPELTRIVQDAGIPCHLSSNLNILPDADAIMAANPASFKISASGFTQEVYGFSHRGGDIERVKKHMVELAEAKKRNNAATRIFVNYHRYRHNLKEEPLMREFAAGIGIDFEPVWALMLPLEKILGHVAGEASDFPLTGEDRHLVGRLALPLKEALEAALKHRGQPCSLREAQISMDFQGNVQLCCGIFDARRFTLGNYLAMSLDEIERLRQSHSMCGRCMRHGAHVYLTYRVPEMEELILGNISPEDAELLDLRYEIARKRLQRRLQKIYQKLFAGIITSEQKAALETQFNRMLRFAGRARRSLHGKG